MATPPSSALPTFRSPETVRIVQNVLWLFADKAVAVLNGLLVGAYVARYLQPERFGILAYGLALTAMLVPLVTLGLDRVLVRDFLRHRDSRAELLWSVFATRLCLGLGVYGLLVTILFSGVLGSASGQEVRTLAILLLSLPIQALAIAQVPVEAQVLSKYTVWIRNAVLLTSAVVKVILVRSGAGLEAFALVVVGTDLLASLILVRLALWKSWLPLPPRFRLGIVRRLVQEGWPLLVTALGVSLYMNLDLAMLRHFRGEAAAGIYSVAVYLSSFWLFLPMTLGVSFFPSMIARQHNAANYPAFLAQLCKLNTLTAYLCVLGSWIAFPIVIQQLYGPEYQGAISILMLHLCSLPFVFLGVVRSQHLVTEGKTLVIMLYTLCGLAVNLGLNWFWIPAYGGHGAAAATLISYAIAAFATSFLHPSTRPFGRLQLQALLSPLPSARTLGLR